MSGPEERRCAVELYSVAMIMAQLVERATGPSDQAVPGMLAGGGSSVCWPYGQNHHPTEDKNEGDRTGAGRHARKQAAERLGVSVGVVHNWVKAHREGGTAALKPRNRNVGSRIWSWRTR